MKPADINMNMIESYFAILKNLSSESKKELIARLSSSLKSPAPLKEEELFLLFGAFVSDQTADEMIKDIRGSRTFNHQRDEI